MAAAAGGARWWQPCRRTAPHGVMSQRASQGRVVLRGIPGQLVLHSLPELAAVLARASGG